LAIDAQSGRLTVLGEAPAAGSMPYLSVDRTGRFLLTVTNPWHGPQGLGSQISVSAIVTKAGNGVVQAPHQVLPMRKKAHCVWATPSNRHVYATSCDEDVIVCHAFDAETGRLSEDSATYDVEQGAGPRHMTFHPNGRFLYLLNEYDGSLYAFAHDAQSGRLDRLQICSVWSRPAPGKSVRASDIHVTPDGRFLYAAERCSNTLAAFSIDAASGRLTFIASYPAENEPRGFHMDPTGRYVFVVGRLSDGVTVYAIDAASGALTVVARQPVAPAPPAQGFTDLPPMKPEECGVRGPNWVEFVRLG
jgi:6-phosphogluconolactonase